MFYRNDLWNMFRNGTSSDSCNFGNEEFKLAGAFTHNHHVFCHQLFCNACWLRISTVTGSVWSLRERGSLAYLMFWLWDAPTGNSKERWSYSPHLPSPGHTHTWAHYCTPTTHTYTKIPQYFSAAFQLNLLLAEHAGTWISVLFIYIQY